MPPKTVGQVRSVRKGNIVLQRTLPDIEKKRGKSLVNISPVDCFMVNENKDLTFNHLNCKLQFK